MRDQAEKLRELVKKQKKSSTGTGYQGIGRTQTLLDKETQVITVVSGKGGVGKSALVVNLSGALHEMNSKVLLIDGNFGLFNLDILMGIRSNNKLEQLMLGEIPWEQAVVTVYPGLDLICGSKNSHGSDGYVQDNQGDKLKAGLQFISDIKKSANYDYIIIDTGAGVNKTVFAFTELSDLSAVVTTPELTAVTDTYALIKSLIYMNISSEFKLIINRCLTKSEALSTWKNLSRVLKHYIDFDIDMLGYIFEDSQITNSIKSQRPALTFKSNTPAGLAIRSLARELSTDRITEA